jgi:peroxiredoxin
MVPPDEARNTGTQTRVLQRGDIVPHFEVTRHSGEPFNYASIGQRRALVLVLLPGADPDRERRYATGAAARRSDFSAREAELVVSNGPLAGVAAPAVVVADRWGEIAHVQTVHDIGALPPVEELLDWAEYVRHRCPECEGEAR